MGRGEEGKQNGPLRLGEGRESIATAVAYLAGGASLRASARPAPIKGRRHMSMAMHIGAEWLLWRRIWIIRSSVVFLLFLCCLSVVSLTQSQKKYPQQIGRGASSLFSSCLTRQQYAANDLGALRLWSVG